LRQPWRLSYRRRVAYRYWPLFELRLGTPDLALRPMAEADLAAIADLLPDDVEMDPAQYAYESEDPRLSRASSPPGVLAGLRNLVSPGLAAWLRGPLCGR
jgi:hypothetical protein